MSIKPIDIQTNIAQITEVGRGEQARNEGVVEQQHVMEKDSNEKSRLVNSKLDEMKKQEKTGIHDEEAKEKEKERQKKQEGKAEFKADKQRKLAKDDRMGRIIDVLK